MPLFRFHKGGLEESLKTTVIVKNLFELKNIIDPAMREWIFIKDNENIDLKIEPYPSIGDNFDPRIGWFTHIVIATYRNTTTHPIGFLSEPLNDNEETKNA